ncbi:hypothetical protein OSB04_004245 [Centaurea solstitialis]|uniref:SOUL heme-binding protein n=1 Tax=Centaurea solstitialis TaxID=347529 RepID=A0AA38WVJ1_9ASTR|nr:hypothetical protein OSB04_004245 [Centaurea solstitialis]
MEPIWPNQSEEIDGKRNLFISTIIIVNLVCILGFSNAYESPEYTVIHSESEFEIRFYTQSVWMTAPVKETNFRKATNDGFHRLFQYIEGANLNNSRVSMTVPDPHISCNSTCPPSSKPHPLFLFRTEPLPDSWTSCCKAVRQFSGFARDKNTAKEAEQLATSLSKSPWANSTSSSSKFVYSIAQYNSPLKFFGRVNEVWVDIDGCEPSMVATH